MSRPLLLALAPILLAPLASSQVVYEVQLVDPLGTGAIVLGLNDAGVCTGVAVSSDPTDATLILRTAFVSDGVTTTLLPPLPGRPQSIGVEMILGSAVVGHSVEDTGGVFLDTYPTVWLASGPVELQLPPGQLTGEVRGANRAATIVGLSMAGGARQPVVWRRQSQPEVLALPAGISQGYANGVNAAGTIVGGAQDANGTPVGFLIEPNGALTLVPQGELIDVNAAGLAIGKGPAAFSPPFYYQQGQATNVPLPGGGFLSLLADVDDSGRAVGRAIVSGGLRGIITDGTTTTDLNTLLDPVTGAGVFVQEAYCINASGQIGGAAVLSSGGGLVGCILTPQ